MSEHQIFWEQHGTLNSEQLAIPTHVEMQSIEYGGQLVIPYLGLDPADMEQHQWEQNTTDNVQEVLDIIDKFKHQQQPYKTIPNDKQIENLESGGEDIAPE